MRTNGGALVRRVTIIVFINLSVTVNYGTSSNCLWGGKTLFYSNSQSVTVESASSAYRIKRVLPRVNAESFF